MLQHDMTTIDISSQEEFFEKLHILKTKFDALEPALELIVEDPDMGVEGFVVVWNTDICKDGPLSKNDVGCGKGGTRIMKGLSLNDVRRLSRAMAEKNAAAGLPLGGAKSGLNTDPESPDYEKKWKRFVALVKEQKVLFEDGGVFGGFGYDIGGKPPLNAIWTVEQLGSGKSFTGKPLDMGGTDYDKIGIAGYGVAVAGKTLIEHKKARMQDANFAVQGIGAMGGAVMRYFFGFGGKLKAVSDLRFGGSWVFETYASEEFINNPTLEILEKEAHKISDDTLEALYQPVDIIFPCALEDTFTRENAHKVQAPFMAEGANNPTTNEAHEILFAKGTIVIPDIIANPGGVIAAYVEMTSEGNDKPQEAMAFTKEKIAENVATLLGYVDALNVRPDLVADYMTYKNIFKEGTNE